MAQAQSRKKEGATWDRFGRRFVVRLSLKRPEEKAILDEYDRRTELLGRKDMDYLKACLVVGHKILSNKGFDAQDIALSTNESNNTAAEQLITPVPEARVRKGTPKKPEVSPAQPLPPGAGAGSEVAKQTETPGALPPQGGGAKPTPARALLGGLMKHG